MTEKTVHFLKQDLKRKGTKWFIKWKVDGFEHKLTKVEVKDILDAFVPCVWIKIQVVDGNEFTLLFDDENFDDYKKQNGRK